MKLLALLFLLQICICKKCENYQNIKPISIKIVHYGYDAERLADYINMREISQIPTIAIDTTSNIVINNNIANNKISSECILLSTNKKSKYSKLNEQIKKFIKVLDLTNEIDVESKLISKFNNDIIKNYNNPCRV